LVINFEERTKIKYTRLRGQVSLDIRIVCEGSTNSDTIEFIYDTGAYITVINKENYEWFGLEKLPRTEATLGGYVSSAPGYVFQVPGLVIGTRLLSGVWAFSPKSEELQQCLLVDNVIEYFRPFQDNAREANILRFKPL